ncbi:hypothetical protein GMST_08340 [Geomonas silvestris]|uniref:Uncharacterized protein n=1 Tax=Geomonas silvestris TaxID=2740184 RepID=A0A6V8MFR3_9BACT|nr:DUF11 domain-containing protein [Geomonas silvestris]GFO58509.1 hypothetical protein GMST_08340 [Geomonas silvestris]
MKRILNLCAAGALALVALAPCSAHAAGTQGSAANAKILNVVTVTYYDATGSNVHQAATSTSVLVALKPTQLTATVVNPFPNVDSGTTTTSLIALTSNANGPDTYKATWASSTQYLVTPTGITGTILTDVTGGSSTSYTSGADLALGATSIVSVQPAAGGSQVINIPAGSLNGIVPGSVVVINDTSYKVTATSAGTQAGYTQTGVSTTTGTATAEVLGSITITTDTHGSNVAPSLAGSLAGMIVGERKYLQLQDTAVVSSNTNNGVDTVSIVTDTKTGGYATSALNDTATFFFVSVSIEKTVANVTSPGASGGKPGEVLEYTVTVRNASSGNAGKVSIADAVPSYTTLVSGPGAYGTGTGNLTPSASDKFAVVSDGTNSVDITLNPSDSESQTVVVGYGGTQNNAAVAGTPITFFLGSGSSSTLGGTVAASKTYTIKYQVKIN